LTFPSRAEVEERLVNLAEGRLSPEDAADWAQPYVIDDATHPEVMDWPVWQAIQQICGADLLATSDQLLHGHDDFLTWLTDFRATVA
jgi:hypothetical protein